MPLVLHVTGCIVSIHASNLAISTQHNLVGTHLVTVVATSSPYWHAIHASVTSIPAETPLEDQIFPSTAQRACGIQCAVGSVATTESQAALFVVARTPDISPVLATTIAPVHTVMRYLKLREDIRDIIECRVDVWRTRAEASWDEQDFDVRRCGCECVRGWNPDEGTGVHWIHGSELWAC